MDKQQPPKRQIDPSRWIGWIIFGLVLFAGPLSSIARQILGPLGNQFASNLPLIIGGLVALSFVVSIIRGISARQNPPPSPLPKAPSLPTTRAKPAPSRAESPFDAPPILPPSRSLPPTAQLPNAPQFDPLISPTMIIVGVIGLIGLFVIAALLFLGGI